MRICLFLIAGLNKENLLTWQGLGLYPAVQDSMPLIPMNRRGIKV